MTRTCVFFLIFLGFSTSIGARNAAVSIGINHERNSDAMSYDVNYRLTYSRYLSGYVGYSWLEATDAQNDVQTTQQSDSPLTLIYGTQAALLLHPDSGWLKPYLGFGLFPARYNECAGSLGQCRSRTVFGAYSEVGMQADLFQVLQIHGYVRRFTYDTQSFDPQTFVGVALTFQY